MKDPPYLQRRAANFEALTPITFLDRATEVYPDRTAVVHGSLRRSYRELHTRCLRLADALRRRGIQRGETVAVLSPNIPEGIEVLCSGAPTALLSMCIGVV
jgi:fatty-acyl-CoA synthase